jgi:hypothetical protein
MFAMTAFWFGLTVWLETRRIGTTLPSAPFLLASTAAIGLMLTGRGRRDLRLAIRGVRAALITIAAAGVIMVAGMIWPGHLSDGLTAWLFFVSMGGLMLVFGIVPLLLPLAGIEGRLRARAADGNPPWHPHLATTTQRREATLAFAIGVGAVSCGAVGVVAGFEGFSLSDPEAAGQPLSQGWFGMLGGMLLGAVAGGPIGILLNDRNLARALPPIALVAPFAGLGASLFGVGWGIAAVFVSMLAVALVMERRHRLFEPHRCQSCGYDLTGLLPDGGPCPECGAMASPLAPPVAQAAGGDGTADARARPYHRGDPEAADSDEEPARDRGILRSE